MNSLRGLGAFALAALLLSPGCASGPETRKISNNERARLYVQVANGALIEGDPTGALQNLAAAEELDASLPEIPYSRALAYNAKKDLERALVEARKAVKMAPQSPDANNTLGKLLIDSGRYDEAESYLLVAANNTLYREAYKAQTNLGIMHYRRGNYAKAERHLASAINEAPQLACIAHYYRGHLRLRESRFSEAIGDYDKATQRFCAGFSEAHMALGIAYEQNKQYDYARKKFLEIQQRYPNTKLYDQAMNHLRYLP